MDPGFLQSVFVQLGAIGILIWVLISNNREKNETIRGKDEIIAALNQRIYDLSDKLAVSSRESIQSVNEVQRLATTLEAIIRQGRQT